MYLHLLFEMGGCEFGDFLVFASLSKIGSLGEGVYKVSVGIHACLFGRFDEGVKDGAGLGPHGGVGKEKVLLPITNGFMLRSARLFVNSSRPSLVPFIR